MTKYFLLWFPMLLIAIGNGVIREAWLKNHMSPHAAHQLSTATLILFFAVYMKIIFDRFPIDNASSALMVGVMWMVMTLIFEFGFGRWRGVAWSELTADYNLLKGRLWALIPLWVGIGPYVFYRLSGRH